MQMSDSDFGFGFMMGVVCAVFVGMFLSSNSSPSMYSFDCYDDSGKILWSENVTWGNYIVDGDYAYTQTNNEKHVCRTKWVIEKTGNRDCNTHTFNCYDDDGKLLWSESNLENYDYTTDGDYAYTGSYEHKHVCRTKWEIQEEC
jgi:hypothetical protein